MNFDNNKITIDNVAIEYVPTYKYKNWSGLYADSPDYTYVYFGITDIPMKYKTYCSMRLFNDLGTMFIYNGVQNFYSFKDGDYSGYTKMQSATLQIPEDINADKIFLANARVMEAMGVVKPFSLEISTWKNLNEPFMFLKQYANYNCLSLSSAQDLIDPCGHWERFLDIAFDFIVDYITSYLVFNDTFYENKKQILQMFQYMDQCIEHIRTVSNRYDPMSRYIIAMNYVVGSNLYYQANFHNYIVFLDMIISQKNRECILNSTNGLGDLSEYGIWDHFQRMQFKVPNMRFHDFINTAYKLVIGNL